MRPLRQCRTNERSSGDRFTLRLPSVREHGSAVDRTRSSAKRYKSNAQFFNSDIIALSALSASPIRRSVTHGSVRFFLKKLSPCLFTKTMRSQWFFIQHITKSRAFSTSSAATARTFSSSSRPNAFSFLSKVRATSREDDDFFPTTVAEISSTFDSIAATHSTLVASLAQHEEEQEAFE